MVPSKFKLLSFSNFKYKLKKYLLVIINLQDNYSITAGGGHTVQILEWTYDDIFYVVLKSFSFLSISVLLQIMMFTI